MYTKRSLNKTDAILGHLNIIHSELQEEVHCGVPQGVKFRSSCINHHIYVTDVCSDISLVAHTVLFAIVTI